jgi:opacity protein-like surface antigen
VRICVLDACASGAFTRLKGGRVRQPFLVDQSAEVSGHAFVTSSSETETAQESDRLGASYFTYYLISGLRGAADLSGEGKVTLNEAYQFAYNETLGRTVDTRGGAQHPRYEIDLSGTGDVIITDLRQTTATLVLAEPLDGRVFVRNAAHHLVVELYKPRGRRVELGLEPGAYEVRVERPASALLARSQLLDGGRVVLDLGQFGPTTPEATRRRGGLGPDYTVSGRTRLGLRMGTWRVGARSGQTIISSSGSRSAGLLAGLQYAHFFGENLAVTVNANVLPLDSGSFVTSDGWFDGSATVVALPIGLRWTPAMKDLRTRWAKPFLAIGVGPVVGSLSGSGSTADGAISGSQTYTTIGGHLGAGVDFHLSGRWSIELSGGYNWMLDFARPLRGRRNYAGIDFGASIGRLFGGGSQTR